MSSPAGNEGNSCTIRTTRLNEYVSIIRPLEDSYDPSSPSLVIIFSWYKAKPSHIAKYVNDFHHVYPTTTVLVIESHSAWLFQSQSTREISLSPVADVLDELQRLEGSRFRGVLLHVMSNGGSVQLMTLTKVLVKRARQSSARYPVALVLDSTPDANTLRCLKTGISAGFRNPLLKLAAAPAILLIYSVFRLTYNIRTGVLPEVRQLLLSPILVPFQRNPARRRNGTFIDYPQVLASANVAQEIQWIPRLYVYSEEDVITDFHAVQNHIEEARKVGLDVTVEIYDKSPHVSHARVDPERYWAAVQELWRSACRRMTSAKL